MTAYWCEGCKSKPYDRREQVTFVNSDPGSILLFLAWLDQIDFPREHRHFSLSIHESADVPGTTAWWSDVTGVPSDDFGRAVLKRHNPKTVRKNTSARTSGAWSSAPGSAGACTSRSRGPGRASWGGC